MLAFLRPTGRALYNLLQRPASLGAVIALCCGMIAVLLARLGQDSNWDLRNYHYYNGQSLLSGRAAQDIAAAQLQGFHNPLIDLPLAWLIEQGVSGVWITAWLALPAVVGLVAANRLLDACSPGHASLFRTGCFSAMAITGCAAVATLGTTFFDWGPLAGVLLALLWLQRHYGHSSDWKTWVPAGVVAGFVAGLKLTAAMYCLGLAGAALVVGAWQTAPRRLLALALGGTIGAAGSIGSWAWHLYSRFDSPVFPYFNQWFRSPWAAPISFSDLRFRPDTALDALLAPLYLALGTDRFAEHMLRDARLLIGFVCVLIMSALLARRRSALVASAPINRMLIAFFLLSFVIWAGMYGIYRYLIVLELLAALLLMQLISLLPRPHTVQLSALLAALLAFYLTDHVSWGRQRFQQPMIALHYPALPQDSLVLLSGNEPLAYAVSFLPEEVPAISVYNNFMRPDLCYGLQQAAHARIDQHHGPLWWLRQVKHDPDGEVWLRYLGLSVAAPCLAVASSMTPLQLCPLQWQDRNAAASRLNCQADAP